MTFVRFWIGFSLIGLTSTVVILAWALKHRQFREPDRAGFLPLADVEQAPPATRLSRETLSLLAVLTMGLAALAATACVALGLV